jgi:tRNA threonylcarbamoyladenosine biosynthesis protein TsaE
VSDYDLPLELELPDTAATEALAARLAPLLRPGDLILLEGPLGAGKTTLVRGLATALGGDAAEVCSPTFVLLESYAVDAGAIRRLHHADLYRLRGRSAAPLDEVGLGECLDDSAAVTAVEWPESWPWLPDLAARVVRVCLSYAGDGRRARVSLT